MVIRPSFIPKVGFSEKNEIKMKSEAKRILKLFWKITSFKSNTRVVILLAVSAVIYSCNFEKKNNRRNHYIGKT